MLNISVSCLQGIHIFSEMRHMSKPSQRVQQTQNYCFDQHMDVPVIQGKCALGRIQQRLWHMC